MFKLPSGSTLVIWAFALGYAPAAALATDVSPASQASGPGPLIDVGQLAEMLGDDHLVILDLGPEKETWDRQHIPAARYVDWVRDITDLAQSERYNLPDQAAMQKLLRRLGVTDDSTIVLYDDMSSRVSTRMYWSLKYYGLDRIHVLDGGRSAWVAAGKPMSDKTSAPRPSRFEIRETRPQLAIEIDAIADRLQDPKVNLVDGRPVPQYSGAEPGKVFHTGALHRKRGHIPGAVNIVWKDNFNEDGTFKSAEELAKLYESVTGSELVVTYCNEGLHAAPPWFVMSEILGHGNVRLYDASMSEWGNSDQPTEVTSRDKK